MKNRSAYFEVQHKNAGLWKFYSYGKPKLRALLSPLQLRIVKRFGNYCGRKLRVRGPMEYATYLEREAARRVANRNN